MYLKTQQFSTGIAADGGGVDYELTNLQTSISQIVTGWEPISGDCTYASADAPTFVITVPSDATTKYSVGMKIKLTQTTIKYFIITAVTATTLTVYGGTDYTLANAAITLPYYSTQKAPLGFPLNPTKWTVETTDTTSRTQANPAANTWYNLGSVSISVPIGSWRVYYNVFLALAATSTTGNSNQRASITLSTVNNTESDTQFTTIIDSVVYISATTAYIASSMTREKVLNLTSKTPYYLNSRSLYNATTLYNNNDLSPAIIRVVCTYL